ncbi:MAG: penicillin-binding protein 1C [bacterium]|nr:penicillin-binding protein 1C [bacterium]
MQNVRYLLFLLVVICVMLLVALFSSSRPLLVNRANGSYAVTDREGNLLRLSLTSDEKYRLWEPLDQMPQSLLEATLNYEDRWFYRHPGVNPFSLVRASWSSIISRARWIGASTLTMQLARQRWRLKTSSLTGKVRQIAYAMWLEWHFSKDELLEAYLNLAPYGLNIEGAGAAAWIYFQKPLSGLSQDEARFLALIPQNPNARAPRNKVSRDSLRQVWLRVYGDERGFDRLWFRGRKDLPFRAPHFAERLHELYPEASTLKSALDGNLQSLGQELLRGYLAQHKMKGVRNASLMIVHAPTMSVRAYVGSADYFDRQIHGFVNGLKAGRSPGSTLKPFIYAEAIAQGLITPDSRLKDTPLRVGYYQPENYERNFYGPLSATEALVRSRNIPAISLLARLREPTFHQFLEGAGISLPRKEINYGLSLAIGSADISLEDLLKLYGMLANNGRLLSLHWLKGEEIFDRTDEVAPYLLPEAAYLVREMLTHNPRVQRRYGGRSFSADDQIAWKTGTSNGLRDAWAIGMMGEWLLGVWVGNFDGSANRHFVGRELAGPLLFDVFDAIAVEYAGVAAGARPTNLKKIDVCPLSGKPVSKWCPHHKEGWIVPGVSPIATCRLHRAIYVNPETGLRVCREDREKATMRVAEFWDSDELQAFRDAGLSRAPLPAFEKQCSDEMSAGEEVGGPKITSPQEGVSYPFVSAEGSAVEFAAVATSGEKIFWFVDDTYVGEGASIHWPARPGEYLVVAVDGLGNASRVILKIEQG